MLFSAFAPGRRLFARTTLIGGSRAVDILHFRAVFIVMFFVGGGGESVSVLRVCWCVVDYDYSVFPLESDTSAMPRPNAQGEIVRWRQSLIRFSANMMLGG